MDTQAATTSLRQTFQDCTTVLHMVPDAVMAARELIEAYDAVVGTVSTATRAIVLALALEEIQKINGYKMRADRWVVVPYNGMVYLVNTHGMVAYYSPRVDGEADAPFAVKIADLRIDQSRCTCGTTAHDVTVPGFGKILHALMIDLRVR